MRIGSLVRRIDSVGGRWLGIVLDWRHTGRFYPGIELTVKWTTDEGESFISPIQEKEVEYIDEEE